MQESLGLCGVKLVKFVRFVRIGDVQLKRLLCDEDDRVVRPFSEMLGRKPTFPAASVLSYGHGL